MPEQLGHEVKIHGDYEYCLNCGKYTKAKHIETAKHVFWRKDICTPVLRLRQYHDTQHTTGFDGWCHCTKCDARGPGLNKQFCNAYTHNRWESTHSDHTDHDSDGDCPGHKVRK
eukprot:14125777-Heterocapsa_arctica.AAC.1